MSAPPTDEPLVPLADRLPPAGEVDLGVDADLPRRFPVSAGDRLAGRYRLVEALPGAVGGSALLWRAVDEVLDRQVAVTVLPARSRTGAARPFLEAAARTGPVLAPALARTFDAALEERPGRDGEPRVVAAYAISEWVDGRALPAVLEDGPLLPVEAVSLVAQAAEAMSAVHERGVVHGRIAPGEVLLTADGRVRITGALLAAVTHGQTPPGGEEGVRADTRALAEVLYALLTARWPGDPSRAGGLPEAPRSGDRVLSPRQVRAGVPRALDLVVRAALDPVSAPSTPAPTTPAALAAAALAAVADRQEAPARPRRRLPAPVRRALPWAASLLLLVVVGIAGFRLGLDVGDLEVPEDPLQAVVAPTTPPRPDAGPAVLDLSDLVVQAVDPAGDDENPGEVPNAYDGDLTTAWSTETYRTPTFGGLKPGVGLLVDLTERTGLVRVEADLTAAGATLEVRAGDDPARLVPVAVVEDAGESVVLSPRGTARGRYWQLWITRLPEGDDGARVGVRELRLVRAG